MVVLLAVLSALSCDPDYPGGCICFVTRSPKCVFSLGLKLSENEKEFGGLITTWLRAKAPHAIKFCNWRELG